MSKNTFSKNAWEYFPHVGGIKIRGLGILPDQKLKKHILIVLYFGVGGMGGAL